MACKVIQTADGRIELRYSYMMEHEARSAARRELYALEHGSDTRNWWWRCTNDKNEDVRCSSIKSYNHRDGHYENGLSVSQHTSYQAWGSYKYIYAVTGTLIGSGSDGEPVLADAVALTRPARRPSKRYVAEAQSLSNAPAGVTDSAINSAKCVCDFAGTLIDGESVLFEAF